MAAMANASVEPDSSGMRCSGPGRLESSNKEKVDSDATNTSLTTKAWLPVPHSPETSHVSLSSTSMRGSTIMRNGGSRPSATGHWATK